MNPEQPGNDGREEAVQENNAQTAGNEAVDFNDPRARLRHRLGTLFDSETDPVRRIDELKRRLGALVQFVGLSQDEIYAELDSCSGIQEKEVFVDTISSLLEPIVIAQIEKPQEFESIARQEFRDQGGFISVNELLAYGIHGKTLHLHVMPNKTTALKDKIRMIRDGMKRIAEIVRDNEEIEEVTGTSWIVADHPKLMEQMGFTVEGPIDDEFRKQHFEGDPREIHHARIGRDDVLRKYL